MTMVQRRWYLRVRRRLTLGLLFLVALVVLAHSVWDYWALKKLASAVEQVRSEQIQRNPGGGSLSTPDSADASALYAAAALLATGQPDIATALRRTLGGTLSRADLLNVAEQIRGLVETEADALRLTDLGSGRPFNELPPGLAYDYLDASLIELSQLVGARTLTLAADQRADDAVQSAESALQLRRALRQRGLTVPTDLQLPAILSLAGPSDDALLRLQELLTAEDKPNRLAERLTVLRRRHLGALQAPSVNTADGLLQFSYLQREGLLARLKRPLVTHALLLLLERWSATVAAAADVLQLEQVASRAREEQPWWARLLGSDAPNMNLPAAAAAVGLSSDDTIATRCALVAVAVERYRRAHRVLPDDLSELVPAYLSAIPIDPYTRQPMRFATDSVTSYAVYSVGPDGRDNNGLALAGPLQGRQPGATQPSDVGLRVPFSR